MGAIAREAEACFNNEKFFEDLLAAVSSLLTFLFISASEVRLDRWAEVGPQW
jgi:hypothetical protein